MTTETQPQTQQEATRQLQYVIDDCQVTGLFKHLTHEGPICLLEHIYQETTCKYLGKLVHDGLDYYHLCCNHSDFKTRPREKIK